MLGLDAGTYRLRFTDSSGEMVPGVLTGVSVTAGGTTAGRDITLGAAGTVSGTVSGPAGAVLTNVRVEAYDADNRSVGSTSVEADGSFTMDGLEPGTLRLAFSDRTGVLAPGSLSGVSVATGQTTTGRNITLTAFGKVTGTVTGPSGLITTSVRINAYGADGSWMRRTNASADGTYSLDGLPTGTYRLEFTDDGRESAPGTLSGVSVVTGETTSGHDIALVVGGTVSGTVTGPTRVSLTSVEVTLYGEDDAWLGSTSLESDGSFVLGGLATGTYRLEVADWDEVLAPESLRGVDVEAGRTTTGQNLALTLGGTVTGTVTVPDGMELDGVSITVYDADDEYMGNANADVNGAYTLTGLASGLYRLEFGDWQGRVAGGELSGVSVTNGQTTSGRDITLVATGKVIGTVRGPNGRVRSDVYVAAYDQNDKRVSGDSTSAGGSYILRGLAAGTYRLEFSDRAGRFETEVLPGVGVTSGQTTLAPDVALVVKVVVPKFVNRTLPVISGTAKVGASLSASAGTWSPATGTYAYQWLAGGTPIAGARAASYKPVAGDVGKRLSVRVTASRPGMTSASATSVQTAAVLAASVGPPVRITLRNLAAPKVKGKAKVKKTLRATAGTWAPATGIRYTYQWYAGSKKIKKATGTKLRLTTKMRGKKISVRVTATMTGATAVTAKSRATKKVKR